ncbi:hypothetical protein FNH22_06040 [Fulvivirga sp. M361]|uniref:hypothetical protein n=1 Tax=Fulvivirga sp. M361 TaxID=2594266 RepID=UPI00117A4688|nr:hypothetical protein [Fulvivirga sp. M361]TRX60607.1 hypothetical protein FNH22_06040 [Fulvivirga sp. M361]
MHPYLGIWLKTGNTVNKVLTGKVKFNFIIPVILVSFSNALEALKLDFGLPGKIMAVLVVTGMGTFFSTCDSPVNTESWTLMEWTSRYARLTENSGFDADPCFVDLIGTTGPLIFR